MSTTPSGRPVHRHIINWIGGCLLFAAAASLSFLVFTHGDSKYHHDIVDVKVRAYRTAPGVEIHVMASVRRFVPMDCSLELHRFVLDVDTNEVVWSQIAPGISSPQDIRVQDIPRTFVVPYLTKEQYKLATQAINDCGAVRVVSNIKIVTFTIEEP